MGSADNPVLHKDNTNGNQKYNFKLGDSHPSDRNDFRNSGSQVKVLQANGFTTDFSRQQLLSGNGSRGSLVYQAAGRKDPVRVDSGGKSQTFRDHEYQGVGFNSRLLGKNQEGQYGLSDRYDRQAFHPERYDRYRGNFYGNRFYGGPRYGYGGGVNVFIDLNRVFHGVRGFVTGHYDDSEPRYYPQNARVRGDVREYADRDAGEHLNIREQKEEALASRDPQQYLKFAVAEAELASHVLTSNKDNTKEGRADARAMRDREGQIFVGHGLPFINSTAAIDSLKSAYEAGASDPRKLRQLEMVWRSVDNVPRGEHRDAELIARLDGLKKDWGSMPAAETEAVLHAPPQELHTANAEQKAILADDTMFNNKNDDELLLKRVTDYLEKEHADPAKIAEIRKNLAGKKDLSLSKGASAAFMLELNDNFRGDHLTDEQKKELLKDMLQISQDGGKKAEEVGKGLDPRVIDKMITEAKAVMAAAR